MGAPPSLDYFEGNTEHHEYSLVELLNNRRDGPIITSEKGATPQTLDLCPDFPDWPRP